MATCSKSTSSIPKPNAPMPAAGRAESKASGYSAGATSKSKRSISSARNRTSSKRPTEGSVTDAGDVYTEYPNPRRDEWAKTLAILRLAPAEAITVATGISRRTVQRIRNGHSQPTRRNKTLLEQFAKTWVSCPGKV